MLQLLSQFSLRTGPLIVNLLFRDLRDVISGGKTATSQSFGPGEYQFYLPPET